MTCSTCDGKGEYRDNSYSNGGLKFKKVSCHNCGGTGEKPLQMSHEELSQEGNRAVTIYCDAEDCDYFLVKDIAAMNYFRVAMDGGYIMFCKSECSDGGLETQCPKCNNSTLIIDPTD